MPHDAIVMIDPDENRLLELPLSGEPPEDGLDKYSLSTSNA